MVPSAQTIALQALHEHVAEHPRERLPFRRVGVEGESEFRRAVVEAARGAELLHAKHALAALDDGVEHLPSAIEARRAAGT
jgi:hypothetical protein